jgi:hypothetical protein
MLSFRISYPYIYVLEPCALNAEFQDFIPLYNIFFLKNYDFAHNNSPGGDEAASNEG